MPGGSFFIKCLTVVTNTASPGAWVKFNPNLGTYASATNQDIINILNGALSPYYVSLNENSLPPVGFSAGGTGSLQIAMDSENILLGGIATPYLGLPLGFSITSAILNIAENGQGAPGSSSIVQRDGFTILSNNPDFGGTRHINLVPPLVPFGIVYDTYGIIFTTVAGSTPPVTATVRSLNITGTYTFITYQASLIPTNPLTAVGDVITISSAGFGGGGGSGIDLSHISSVIVSYFDNSGNPQSSTITSFISQSQFILTFNMIDYDGAVAVTIDVIGDGTQFSGSVNLGNLPTTNFTDGSGIYVLTPGKTFDTLYAQGITPVQTIAMAIPNPFIKTGFIP